MATGATPTAAHAAIAASAFSTLWRPGTGSVKRCPSAENALDDGSSPIAVPRTPACSLKPKVRAPSANGSRLGASPSTSASRVREAKVANIAATSASLW